jgi:hypothetical protein
VDADATRVVGAATEDEGVEHDGRHMVYRGPKLSHLVIMFVVKRSFTERPKGSNSIEHQLLVVKW